jgi:hypothetical protein
MKNDNNRKVSRAIAKISTLSHSRAIFKKLKEAKAASELKRALMFPIEGTHRGAITKLDINFASIRKDGSGEFVYVDRRNMPASTWRNLTYGARVNFTIFFNFYGPTAGNFQLEDLRQK